MKTEGIQRWCEILNAGQAVFVSVKSGHWEKWTWETIKVKMEIRVEVNEKGEESMNPAWKTIRQFNHLIEQIERGQRNIMWKLRGTKWSHKVSQ